MVSKLLNLITDTKHVHKIILILKNLMINSNEKLNKGNIINTILNTLSFIIDKKESYQLNNEEISEINLILKLYEKNFIQD